MPGAVARTSTFALNNATLPFVLKLANLGAEAAMKADPHLAAGLNVMGGQIRHAAVAEALVVAIGKSMIPARMGDAMWKMKMDVRFEKSCGGMVGSAIYPDIWMKAKITIPRKPATNDKMILHELHGYCVPP